MRRLMILCLVISSIMVFEQYAHATINEKQSIIIEVEGDPLAHKDYIENYYPMVEVVAVYETLLNGLALQSSPKHLTKISALPFVQTTHPVKTYDQGLPTQSSNIHVNTGNQAVLTTEEYTGKGVKVAVIDTGIDYNHPDLAKNYAGGYDLVDLDDDPMETTENEGIPTIHGTHVAGIIAANGKIKGVAPDAEIYAYRALGPGGSGSSIQVIAAMERALKDGVDIMNLSLGNLVNGPDYPTSIAVNRVADLGVAVVIANGNNGPNDWTVGAPATAAGAIAVGALDNPRAVPYLYAYSGDKTIPVTMMQGSLPWKFTKDYEVSLMNEQHDPVLGKIALMERGGDSFYKKAKMAEESGAVAAIIYNNEDGEFQGSIEDQGTPLNIPVVSITKEMGKWLERQMQKQTIYLDTLYKQTEKSVAPFSSRGPVTMDWTLKPDIIAPGTNILSTVPGGYLALQGTSMAAPYVAGAIALMKEANPKWSNEQIIGSLKTTATQLKTKEGIFVEPISQGMGEIQLEKALNTSTIIDDTLLSFGKINQYKESRTIDLTFENTTDRERTYVFDMPRQQKGISWRLPKAFTVKAQEKKTITVGLDITTQQLESGSHQGWITVHSDDETYHLPYLFINQTDDYPHMMGFSFAPKLFSKDMYTYQLYLTEGAEKVEVNLYHPDTLIYHQHLLSITDVKTGINEGEIKRSKVGEKGHFLAIITIQMEDGTIDNYAEEVWID